MANQEYNLYLVKIKCPDNETIFSTEEVSSSTYYTKLTSEKQQDWTLKITDLHYIKEIYRPCELTLNLSVSVTKGKTLMTFAALNEHFLDAEVSVSVKRVTINSNPKEGVSKQYSEETAIISQYFVKEVTPSLLPDHTYDLTLKAYSADYELKTDKFSECYLNSPLPKIIEKENNKLADKKYLSHTINFKCSVEEGLQNISYKVGSDYHVYHTPYAVQYNESFYDFAARLAHRYGEILFFENGSLHLGVDPDLTGNSHDLSSAYKSFKMISMPDSKLSEYISGYQYNYNEARSNPQAPDFSYDVDYAEDMYLENIETQDLSKQSYKVVYENKRKKEVGETIERDFVDWRMFMNWIGLSQKCLTFLSAFRHEDGWWGYDGKEVCSTVAAFAKLGIAWTDAIVGANNKVDKTNSNYQAFLTTLRDAKVGFDAKEQEESGQLRPFGSLTKEEVAKRTEIKKLTGELVGLKKILRPRNEINAKNQLAEAHKSFDTAVSKTKTLHDSIKTIADSVTGFDAGKEFIDYLTRQTKEFVDAAEKKYTKDGKEYTLSELFGKTAKELNDELVSRFNNQDPNDSDYDKKVTDNKEEDNKTSTFKTQIEELEAKVKAFDEVFYVEDNGINGPYSILEAILHLKKKFSVVISDSDYSQITFEAQVSSSKKQSDADKKRIKEFKENLLSIYNSLKEALKASSAQLETTKDNLDMILKNAYFLKNAENAVIAQNKKIATRSLEIVKNNLFHKFLESIEKAEITSAKNRVCLEINPALYDKVPLLGETVEFDGVKYLIINIDSQYKQESGKNYSEKICLELTPAFKPANANAETNGQTPCKWVPPLSACRVTPKVGAMLASVTDNKDPRGIGRLRIKFKWQGKSGVQSPWIRMSTPFASKYGAGMFFNPQKDDEVLVDFYNGNIDLPIIVGALRNENSEKDYVQGFGVGGWHKRNEIANVAGQTLTFKDGFMAFSDAAKLAPGLGTFFTAFKPDWLPYLNYLENVFEGGDSTNFMALDENGRSVDYRDNLFQKYWRGSLTMHDRHDTWSISGSTTDRKVKIASNMGTVTIDALTGISISAPLGDIKISAKNITMEATNNISIESGTQVKRQRKIKKDAKEASITGSILSAAKDIVKTKSAIATVDLSLLRLLTDAIIPPVEGTLLVKSNRYLKLEAGIKANADDQLKAPLVKNKKFSLLDKLKKTKTVDIRAGIGEHAKDAKNMNNALNAIPGFIKTLCKQRAELGRQLLSELNNFSRYVYSIKNTVILPFDTNYWSGLNQIKPEDIQKMSNADLDVLLPKIITVEKDNINKVLDWDDKTTLDVQIKNLGLNVDAEKDDEHVSRYLLALKRKIVSQANAIARLSYSASSPECVDEFVANSANELFTAMGIGPDGTTKWELDENLNIVDHNISRDDLTAAVGELFKQIFKLTNSTQIYPKYYRFENQDFVKSVTRVFLLTLINKTGWYVYRKEFAQAYYEKNELDSNIKNLLPEDNYVETVAGAKQIEYFYAETSKETDILAKNNAYYKNFLKTCQFIIDYWQTLKIEKSTKSKAWGEVADVFGVTDLADDFMKSIGTPIAEACSFKSANHDGRVLISDNGVSVGITKSGDTELTMLNYGNRNWDSNE